MIFFLNRSNFSCGDTKRFLRCYRLVTALGLLLLLATTSSVSADKRPRDNLRHARALGKGPALDAVPTDNRSNNDHCVDAIELRLGEIAEGTTRGMSSGWEPDCGGASASMRADVWYSFTYTGQDPGQQLYATTCTNDDLINQQYASSDTQISVFAGNCSRRTCVAGNHIDFNNNCNWKSGVSFSAERGVRYFFLLHGHAGRAVDFAFQIRPDASSSPSEANDHCVVASPIVLDQIKTGDLAGHTGSGAPACGSASSSGAADAWYRLEGDGHEVLATTCTSDLELNTRFDTQLSVFAGDCGQLRCVGGNDNQGHLDLTCPFHSTVRFHANQGTTYYLVVHGFRGATGRFALEVRHNEK